MIYILILDATFIIAAIVFSGKPIFPKLKQKIDEYQSLLKDTKKLEEKKVQLQEEIVKQEAELKSLKTKSDELLQTIEMDEKKLDKKITEEAVMGLINTMEEASNTLKSQLAEIHSSLKDGFFVLSASKIQSLLHDIKIALKEFKKQKLEHAYLGNIINLYEMSLDALEKGDYESAYYYALASFIYVQIILSDEEEEPEAPSKEDYYSILGLEKNATEEEIKKVYRELVKKYHPDHYPDDLTEEEKAQMEEKFIEIQEAYDILSDPDKRAKYDTTL